MQPSRIVFQIKNLMDITPSIKVVILLYEEGSHNYHYNYYSNSYGESV
jgi:hypothetical protein